MLSKTYDVNQGEDVSLLRSISFAVTEVEFVGLDTADVLYGPVAVGHYAQRKRLVVTPHHLHRRRY